MDLEPFIATVCWYGVPTVDDRVVYERALTVFRLPLPVLTFANTPAYTYECIGKIEAVEDGWDEGHSTMVVMGMADRRALPLDDNGDPIYGVGMDLDMMDASFEDGLMIVRSGRLMAITVHNEPAYPKARIEFTGDQP